MWACRLSRQLFFEGWKREIEKELHEPYREGDTFNWNATGRLELLKVVTEEVERMKR